MWLLGEKSKLGTCNTRCSSFLAIARYRNGTKLRAIAEGGKKVTKSDKTRFDPLKPLRKIQTKKSRVEIKGAKFTNSIGLPFQKLLPESLIEDILETEKIKYRQRLFSPIVTVWAFLSQVQDTDKTCHNAVSRIIAWLAGSGLEIPERRYFCLLSG